MQYKSYEEMGLRWLSGDIEIEEFNGIKLNAKQKEFINSKERFTLVSGGFASGKTTAFIMKLILLCLWFPGNRILLGRKTRQLVEKATLPDFFDICPQGIYEHHVGKGIIEFGNGSQIILWGLDALQAGSGQDIKKAEQDLKSLNLGGVFIDQLEEIEQRILEALDGRLRRNVPFRQINMTTNPANFWGYDYFKANPRKNTKLIETSMMDNKENLPPDYIESQLNQPKQYVMRYVHGEWSPDSMVQGGVFAEDYVKDQAFHVKAPLREFDGIKIYQEPRAEDYQIGVDPSEGAVDPCSITVVSKDSGEIVATYSQFVPLNVITDKILQLAYMYSLKSKPLVIPEVQGGGQAVVEDLKKKYARIYEREIFNQREKKTTKKLGFFTNYATKVQLIENMKNLFQKKFAKVRDKQTHDELKTFIYSDEARMKGAGAQNGYHDDKIMSMMLAYWGITAPTLREKNLLERVTRQERKRVIKYIYQ